MCIMCWKEVCYELDYESTFPWTNFCKKKVIKAKKMLIKQYYRYKFTNLIGTNILHTVFNFIIY